MAQVFPKALLAGLILAAFASSAHAAPDRMRAAIAAMNADALMQAAETGTDADKLLAAALDRAWQGHDDDTVATLAAAADAQIDPTLEAAALRQLMSLHMRRGEFAAAAAAGAAAGVLEPLSASELQAQTFVAALVGIAPTRAIGDPTGVAPIKHDLAGLMRSDISVGGTIIDAILDTGANFSTVNETSARRLGLRMLESNVSVGSSSRDAVASRLAVAEKLSIGGAEFSDVVFIVLPDADLSFANGAYTIDAILGMPVFLEMKRIEFATVDSDHEFRFGDRVTSAGDATRNILYSGLSPMAQLSINANGQPVRLSLLLDSGAQTTSFERAFVRDAALLLEGADTVTSTRGGAGGAVVSDTTRLLATAELSIGGRVVTLSDVDVHETAGGGRHGILGLDALGYNFSIDWQAGVVAVN